MSGGPPPYEGPAPEDPGAGPAPSKAVARSGPAPGGLAFAPSALPAAVEMAAASAAAQAQAAVVARYQMALHRPRDWAKVEASIYAACDRPEFAAAARYKVPRGGKEVTGPSIRFGEEVLRHMGNVLAEQVVTFDDDERRIARVSVTDLESNLTYPYDIVVEKTVERKTSAAGRDIVSERRNSANQKVFRVRATDDELLAKQNMLVSKALRNGVVRLLPSHILSQAMARVEAAVAVASRETGAVAGMVAAFASVGVAEANLVAYLGHAVADVTADEYGALRGIFVALRDGETTWEQVAQRSPAPREPHRGQPGVRTEGYAAPAVSPDRAPAPVAVPTEVINMEDRRVEGRALPNDPYQTTGAGDPAPAGDPAGDVASPAAQAEADRLFDLELQQLRAAGQGDTGGQ